jgi:hypothetical protein
LILDKAIPDRAELEVKHTADPALFAGSVATAMLLQNAAKNLVLSAALKRGADLGAMVRALATPTQSDDPTKPTLSELLNMAIQEKMTALQEAISEGKLDQQKLIELSRPPDPSKQAWSIATGEKSTENGGNE